MGAYTPVPMGVINLAAGSPIKSYYVLPDISCSYWRRRGLQQNARQLPGISFGKVRLLNISMEQQQLGLYTGGRAQGYPFARAVGESDSVYWEREEVRWMREEQRWLREEQRWLREEQRWNIERQSWAQESVALNNEIKALKQEILSLQEANQNATPSGSTLADLMAGLNSLLRSLREAETVETRISSSQAQIASSSSSSRKIDSLPLKDTVPVVTTYLTPVEVVKSAHVEQDPIVFINTRKTQTTTSPETSTSSGTPTAVKQRRTLKKGAEGDDVKVLQEALAALGFYSGEDEMEFSTFDTGTDSAVKTWQSTVGAVEDGVLTKELLARLFEETPKASSVSDKVAPPTVMAPSASPPFPPKGTAVKSKPKPTTVPEIDRYARSGTDNRNERRVYLLGENRWEEPSRLLNRNGRSTSTAVQDSKLNNCFSCKGAGTMMCTECEGTGELNVEEQFLDWVEEGAKCPYCEGSGIVKCDVCN